MIIFCNADACVYNQDGYCTRNEISVNDECECTDYEYYYDREEYQKKYFRAVEKDNVHYKVECKGKRAVENDIAFYYIDKVLEDDTRIIEELTGYMMRYKDLRSDGIKELIREAFAEQGNVADLPEYRKDDEKK